MSMRYPVVFTFVLLTIVALTHSTAGAATYVAEPTTPSIDPATFSTLSLTTLGPELSAIFDPSLTPGLTSSAEAFSFVDNPVVNNNYLFIPPDPICAAGPDHVVNVGNVYIEWRLKNPLVAVPQAKMSLETLFAGTPGMLPPVIPTNMFDPKCTFDQYANRFVVVTLQVNATRTDSRILVAVSKTPDPNAGWWRHAINSTLIIGGIQRWADYPGIATDDDALYLTANMFNSAGTNLGGSRLWIVDKAPTYAGPDGSIAFGVYDAWALSGAVAGTGIVGTTTMPTHMWGPEPAGVGTFLVSTGISDGVNEYVNVIRVDTPLAPAWNWQILNAGDISSGTVPAATQLGSTRTISTVAQRVMNAVWRNGSLYTCNTIKPTVGIDLTQATAHWYRISTVALGALSIPDQGNVGAEDLGAATHTFMPAVNVDRCDNMAIGFSASGPSIYAGAYYATRMLTDAAGTIGASAALALGTDWYVRTFTTSLTAASRWGDYSGLSLCPVDEATFWVYNEYAGPRGTPTGSAPAVEDGRWFTRLGSFIECQTITTAITFFDAVETESGVSLRAEFRSDVGVDAVSVYRAAGAGELQLLETTYGGGESFSYLDRTARAGEYTYQIGVRDSDGEFFSAPVKVSVTGPSMTLDQNTPNPFNPTTTISFTLPERQLTTLAIYDVSGQLVRTLVNNVRAYGKNLVTWDGRDDAGVAVGSGVYFYRLTAGKFSESRKMVLLK
jgi:FlgD Ig-like domain